MPPVLQASHALALRASSGPQALICLITLLRWVHVHRIKENAIGFKRTAHSGVANAGTCESVVKQLENLLKSALHGEDWRNAFAAILTRLLGELRGGWQ